MIGGLCRGCCEGGQKGREFSLKGLFQETLLLPSVLRLSSKVIAIIEFFNMERKFTLKRFFQETLLLPAVLRLSSKVIAIIEFGNMEREFTLKRFF